MKLRTLGFAVLGAVGLAALPGCEKDDALPVVRPAPIEPKAEVPAKPAAQAVTGGGTVTGTITFEGVPPKPASIEPSADPACEGMALTEQALRVKGGKVENVLVRVQGQVPGEAETTQPVIIDQKQCTYVPRVQGAVAGQPILIKNSDGTLHNARGLLGTKSIFNVAQPPNGKSVQRMLPAGAELVRLKCDIHPWMGAWVVVNPNPYFATSGEDGSFTIQGLPAGEHTLEAWHEQLGTRTSKVTVKEGETVSVSFAFSAADAKGTASSGVK